MAPSDHRAALGGVDEQPADVAMRAESGQKLRMTLVDLLERESPWLLEQRDQAEVA